MSFIEKFITNIFSPLFKSNKKPIDNIPIYGAIGYEILSNETNKIIIFADKHDYINSCENSVSIDKFFKKLIDTDSDSEILLEEVERVGNAKNLVLLWKDGKHTVSLKDLYIENQKEIQGIDIRPHITDYSLNIINLININNKRLEGMEVIKLKDYFKTIDLFFSLNLDLIKPKLGNLYTEEYLKNNKLGYHFMKLKHDYYKILDNNKDLLDLDIIYIYTNLNIIEKINNLQSSIIEWYMCAYIIKFYNKPIIVHTGLAHSEKVSLLLTEYYGYSKIKKYGITTLEELLLKEENKIDGCILFPKKYMNYFFSKKI